MIGVLILPTLRRLAHTRHAEGGRDVRANLAVAEQAAFDALVYELYGLTEEEIAIVEAGA